MEGKDSFVFYISWFKYFNKLKTIEQREKLRVLLQDYVTDKFKDIPIEEISCGDDAVDMAFFSIAEDLKKDLSKWKTTCSNRAKAGQLGGLAKARNNKQSVAKIENAKNAKSDVANLADNEYEYDNEYENNVSTSKDIDTCGEVSQEKPTPLIILPCIGNYQHPIFKDDIDHYKELYPAVDILQQFKNMLGWLESNPQNRKTKNGVKAFIARWLSKCQDKAPKVESSSCNQNFTTLGDDYLNEDFKQRPDETYEEYKERIIKDFRKGKDPTASFGGVEKI